MKYVFADTNYWIALLNPKDELHHRAKAKSESLFSSIQIVTSEIILIELLNLVVKRERFAKWLKPKAIQFVKTVMNYSRETNVIVVRYENGLFQQAFNVYQDYQDKYWEITDCASFVIMKNYQITEALTNDEHFEQMGYKALLR